MYCILYIVTGEFVRARQISTVDQNYTSICYTTNSSDALLTYEFKATALSMLKIIAKRCNLDLSEFEIIAL